MTAKGCIQSRKGMNCMKNYKKNTVTIAAFTIFLLLAGCSASLDTSKETEASSAAFNTPAVPAVPSSSEADAETEDFPNTFFTFQNPDMINQNLLTDCIDYAVLVESYLKDSTFTPLESSRTDALSRQLGGHYEVAGRTDGKGREYYLALRRADAPDYEDFYDLSVSYTDGGTPSEQICEIGYYNENMDSVVLYQIADFSVNSFRDASNAESLDMFCFVPCNLADDTAFLYAFGESGRMQLDFLNEHPGLSFPAEDAGSSIDFLYQDQDTVKFWSEPYPCHISLDEKDTDTLKQLFKEPKKQPEFQTDFENRSQILDYVRTLDSSIRTTGARFSMEGKTYELLGSQSCTGYMISYDTSDMGGKTAHLEYNQPVFSYIIDKIKNTVGVDYGSFSDKWFDIPLISATLDFPNLTVSKDGNQTFCVRSQTVMEPEKLARLAQLLKQAVNGPETLSACPYTGILNLTREDGETLQMFVASDSCDSVTYEGRIGFEYGKQEYLADIFDNAMAAEQ